MSPSESFVNLPTWICNINTLMLDQLNQMTPSVSFRKKLKLIYVLYIVSFTSEEKYQMKNLPNREYILT